MPRLSRRPLLLAPVAAMLLAGCQDTELPTALAPATPDAVPARVISHGANGGTEGFYFLPPMVPDPAYGGTFDPDLSPVARVCRLTSEAPYACTGTILKTFNGGARNEALTVDVDGQSYTALWNTKNNPAGLENGPDRYRLEVYVGPLRLGFADLWFVAHNKQLGTVQPGYVGAVNGGTLSIKFRIETGIPAAVSVAPAQALLAPGGSAQFTATVSDLHGAPLDVPVSWSSSDVEVATVDGDGLAAAVAEGEATITAHAGGASGSGTLVVETPAPTAAWHPIGAGLDDGSVLALTVFDGELVAGGSFTRAGGQTVNHIARWNGTSWEALGAGMNDTVHALTVHEGQLIAGGAFTTAGGQPASRIARWNGTAWEPLGIGVDNTVRALAVHDGHLFAGGVFTNTGTTLRRRIARWNGSAWVSVGGGVAGGGVYALTVHDGQLIAGGAISGAAAQPVNNVIRLNGATWEPLGNGLNDIVYALTVHDGQVIAGGIFNQTGGGLTRRRIARFNGTSWVSVGGGVAGPGVYALTVHEGQLIAGGDITGAAAQPVNRIVRLNGADWEPLGDGLGDRVSALTVHHGQLIAGGVFTQTGALTAKRIARWGLP